MISISAGPSCAAAASSAASSLRGVGHPDSERTADLGVLREVGVVQRGLPDVPVAGALLLGDLAELAVVEQHVRDLHAVLDSGQQLGHVLREPAVAGDGEDRPVRRGGPRADRGRVAEPDRAEVAGHQDRLAGLGLEVAAERVGVVADVDRDHGIFGHVAAERGEHDRGVDAAAAIVALAAGFLGSPDRPALGELGALVDPVGRRRARPLAAGGPGRRRSRPRRARSRGGTCRAATGRRRPG